MNNGSRSYGSRCYWAPRLAFKFVARGGDLELLELTKEFDDHVAVENLNLHVPAGEFFALLGPSGCGKTTALRMIAGLEQPSSGSVIIGGVDVTDTRPHQRPVNTVFQNYALFPHMSVLENVAFGLRQRKVSEPLKKAAEALAMVELDSMINRRPNDLSGGQQQRVALARALVNRPSLLLLDEPLGALDLKLRRQMQVELKLLQIEVGLTFLHVTHDQEEAMDMADTVAVMNQGTIEQLGPPEELYDRPKTSYVARFLGQSNIFVGNAQLANDAVFINVGGSRIAAPLLRSENHVGRIAIGVRPEKMSFATSPVADDSEINVLGPGTIIDIRFTGVSNEYLIEIPGVGRVTTFAQNVGKSPVVELGTEVWVSWRVEHAFGLSDLPTKAEAEDED